MDLNNSDEPIFIAYAERLMNGDNYYYPWNPPGVSVSILLVATLVQDYIIAGKLIGSIYVATFMFTGYHYLRIIFPVDNSRKIAFFTMIIYSIFPLVLESTRSINTDFAYGTFFFLNLYYLSQNFIARKRYLFGAALTGAMMALFRWSGLYFLVIEIVILFFRSRQILKGRKMLLKDLEQIFLICLSYITIFFMVMLPWLIHNYNIWGDPFYNVNYHNLAYDGQRGVTPFAIQEYDGIFDFLVQEWRFFLKKFSLNLLLEIPLTIFIQNNYVFVGAYWLKIPIAVLYYSFLGWSIFRLGKRNKISNYSISNQNKIFQYIIQWNARGGLIYFIYILGFFAQAAMGWIIFRYLMPLYPILMAFAGFGFIEIIRDIKENKKKKKSRSKKPELILEEFYVNLSNLRYLNKILYAIFIICIISVGFSIYYPTLRENPQEYRQGGEFLKDYGESNEIIIALNANYYAYFAEMQYHNFLNDYYIDSFSALTYGLEESNADYLIVSEYIDLDRIPFFEQLLDPSDESLIQFNLIPIYFDNSTMHRLVIYHVI